LTELIVSPIKAKPITFNAPRACGQMRTLVRTDKWLTRTPPPEGRGAELPDFPGHFWCRSQRLRTLRPLDRLFFMFRFIFMSSFLFVAFRTMRPLRTG